MAVTTSIVVQFTQGGGDSGRLSAEIDSRPDGLNGGKTNFNPGDTAHFLVFKSDDVVIDEVTASAGSITAGVASDYEIKDEWVNFIDTDEANPAKPISSGLTYQWFGNNLGAVRYLNGKLISDVKGVGVLKISYRTAFLPYSVNSPSSINGLTDFQIGVLVKGHN